MSEVSKRETLLPFEATEILYKQLEVIESLTKLNRLLIEQLAQHMNVEGYERMLSRTLNGYDEPIE